MWRNTQFKTYLETVQYSFDLPTVCTTDSDITKSDLRTSFFIIIINFNKERIFRIHIFCIMYMCFVAATNYDCYTVFASAAYFQRVIIYICAVMLLSFGLWDKVATRELLHILSYHSSRETRSSTMTYETRTFYTIFMIN